MYIMAFPLATVAETNQSAPHFPTARRTWKSHGSCFYYVDDIDGDDTNSGLTFREPWKTLTPINQGVFAAGDHILLRCGGKWTGILFPGGSGVPRKPIVIGQYGYGPKPAINAEGRYLAAVYIRNGDYWDIGSLDIANRAPNPVPKLTGVTIEQEDFGTAHDIRLHDLDIHDVTGSNDKAAGGGSGIYCASSGLKTVTRYDGLVIENCHITHTDRNGITMSAYYRRPEWPLSTGVLIRGNLLEDIGGDGIVPIGCNGCVIEHNTLRGGRMRAQDYAAGIWPWSCDNTIIQFNEVSGMRGTNDGEGFDSDFNCRNSLFQFNYSHDNDGGFMLICDDGGQQSPWNIGNSGTVIRYNISVNDAEHTFCITGPCQNIQIYNNVIYQKKGLNAPIVSAGNWGGGWPEGTSFLNNIFYVEGNSKFDFGGMTGVKFDSNSYWGNINPLPSDINPVLADPKLIEPGSYSVSGYLPRPDSPLISNGKTVAQNSFSDFFGNPLPQGAAINIGAWQGAEKPSEAM